MTDTPKITLVQKKIIKSLLYETYEIMNIFFARIFTCGKQAEYWLYSGLEGALLFVIDIKNKVSKFMLFDLKSYNIIKYQY